MTTRGETIRGKTINSRNQGNHLEEKEVIQEILEKGNSKKVFIILFNELITLQYERNGNQ